MNNSRKPAYCPRALEEACQEASNQFPVLLLTGPRQVGKTSLLEHLRAQGSDAVLKQLDAWTMKSIYAE